MKRDKLKDISELFLEFLPLQQSKITPLFSKNTSDPYKCSRNQIKAIMIIGRNEIIIPTVLGKCLGLQKGSLTTLIDSLEEMDLIKRTPHPDDRRKILISLTPKGNKYRALKINQFETELANLFDKLPEEELDQFIPCFNKVLDVMNKL